MKPRIERARAAGAVGVIATTDWTFANGRDWGSPTVPERINLKTALAFAPDVLRHLGGCSSTSAVGTFPI